jgi:hypothetical protein
MGKLKNSLADDIIDLAAKEMQQEIDKEIMGTIEAEYLFGNGWRDSPVTKPWGPFHTWEAETAEWCHLNCTGDYKYVLHRWWFEHPADATAFTLRFA